MTALKRFSLTGLATIALSGCATTWTATQPAISRESYDLQLLKVRPPLDPTWRLLSYDEVNPQVVFIHAETADKLSAWWVPMSPEEIRQSPEETVLAYFQELFLEDLRYSGDYELSVTTSKEWAISPQGDRGNLMYLKGIQRGSQDFEAWIVYRERQFNGLPLVEVFTYSRPLGPKDRAAGIEGPSQPTEILKRLVERTLPEQADPERVAWQRASTAYERFRVLSEKRGQAKQQQRLPAAHQAAAREIKSAISWIADWPEIQDMAGLLASYNDTYEFFGKGFDAGAAEKSYLQAIRLRKNFALAHLHLARMYQALARWQDALAQFQELSEISPNTATYHYEQAKLLEKLHRPKDALTAYRQALRYWLGASETKKEVEGKIAALEKGAADF